MTAERVREHIKAYGLTTKLPESLENGMALGFRLQNNKAGKLMFGRGNEIPEAKVDLAKRELFSICGKLIGHYPIAG